MIETRDWDAERSTIAAHAVGREAIIAESFARVTGDALVAQGSDPASTLWSHAGVIVAHGLEDDPLFFYGNRAALALFEVSAADFIRLPSRLSAGPEDRDKRAVLMEQVARDNFVRGYSGVRVSASGRRFRIEQAVVWNLLGADGALHGQAAAFGEWTPLDD